MKRLSYPLNMRYIWQRKDWPHFTWQNDLLIGPVSQVRLAQGQLLSRIKQLGFELSREAQAEALLDETLKTAAIEGEKLNPQSVRSSVARQLGLPCAGLTSIEQHVDGLVQLLLDATTHYQKPLTLKRIRGWQAALFPTGYSGIHPVSAGKWRKTDPMQVVSGPIGREKIHFEAPPSKKIEVELKQFLNWWQKSLGKIEGILRAGLAHFHFVTIHPFEDGNGRLARALTDMALAQDEGIAMRFYSLSSQILVERNNYYEILEKTQKGKGDITDWLLWFVEVLSRAIQNSEKIMERVLTKADFWKHHSQTPMSPRQRKVINRLLDAGKDEFKGGLTTRKYVSMTKASRATAFREMCDLVSKGILILNRFKGRSTSYTLVFPNP